MMPFNIEAALFGLAPSSRRCYDARIRAWIAWSKGGPLDREHVQGYLRFLELGGYSAQVQNQSLAALKRLAVEAAEIGRIDPQVAAQVQGIKARPITQIRTVRSLSAAQSSALLVAPDRKNLIGRRDAAVIALLLGCGLQRGEACGLTVEQVVRTTQDRMLIVDLVGKGGRIRSVAVPQWAALDIQRWIGELVPLEPNYLLRSVASAGTINDSLSPSAIRDIVRRYGAVIGVPDLTPQDIRRTCGRLARLGGAPLETIQHTLGHADVGTTARFTRIAEPNAGDYIDIKPAASPLDPSNSRSGRGQTPEPPEPEPTADLSPPLLTPDSGPALEPLQPSASVPQRAPGTRGRRCASYPDMDLRRIGKFLGISSTYVGRILNGHSRPSMGVAQKFAKLMGWTLDQVNGLYNRNTTEPEEEIGTP